MADRPGFFEELKRRHVVRVAIAYVIAAWLIVQVATQLFPFFRIPDWAVRLVVLLLVIGFPAAVAFAWIFELTPEGLRRTAPADSPEARSDPQHHSIGQKLNVIISVILALAVAVTGWRLYAVQHVKTGAVAAATMPTTAPARAASAAPPAPKAPARGPVFPVPATSIPAKSVAVLPFANERGAKDQQFFSDGLSEDLITALSQFAGLKVISRESAFQFRNSKDSSAKIGKLLGVAHLLEGSVQRSGDEVRITATLVDASDGTVLWTQHYDKPYKDLFALQDDITHSVANALKAKLLSTPGAVVQSDRPPSGNLDAYAALQHGDAYMDLGTEAGCRAAIAAYGRAIRLDPRYAVAYAGLSNAWGNLAGSFLSGDPRKQAREKEKAAVDTALKLDPDSSRAHRAHANLLMAAMDWSGAEAEFQRAARLAPNDAGALGSLASVVAALGQNRRAVDLARKSLASNPRNAVEYTNLSGYLAALGHLDAARKAIDTAIALQPGSADQYATLAMVEIQAGNAKAALAAAQKEPPGAWHDVAIALALQIGSDKKAADAALRKLIAEQAGGASYQIAEVYALRGDADNTFKWLDRAWGNRDPGISYLLSDPFILRYRNDPRFAAFCRKVGLPTTTDAVAMK
jgi:TolB-like protein/tetratricopeptide (TPR) repeat protein